MYSYYCGLLLLHKHQYTIFIIYSFCELGLQGLSSINMAPYYYTLGNSAMKWLSGALWASVLKPGQVPTLDTVIFLQSEQ